MHTGRKLRVWHRWLGLGALVLLMLASASGTLLAYQRELVRVLVTPGAVLPAALRAEDLAPQLDRIVARFPSQERELIKAPNSEEPFWTLTASGGRTRLLAIGSLEPYGENLWVVEGFAVLRHLHAELLAGIVGEVVLLTAGLAGLTLTVTGLLLWWPRRARCRWLLLRPRSLGSPLVLQHHQHFGAAAAPLVLLSLLTGTLMVWQKTVGPLLPMEAEAVGQPALDPGAPPASRLLIQAQTRVPGGWPTYIRLGMPGDPEVSFRFRLPGEWHPNGRSSVRVDLRTGQVVVSRADRVSTGRWLVNQLYPLHSGYGLPLPYSLLVAAAGTSLCWLCLSGVSGWWPHMPVSRLRNMKNTAPTRHKAAHR